MDPSLFSFPSPNLHLQQSKLATYMNLNIPPIGLQAIEPIDLHSPPPEYHRKEENEFIPGMYYTGSEILHLSPPKSPIINMYPPENCLPPPSIVQVHQENVGGTTYFFSTNTEIIPAMPQVMPQVMPLQHPHMYPVLPPPKHYINTPMYPKSGLTSSFRLRDSLMTEILTKNQISHALPNYSEMLNLPMAVEQYIDLIPLENMETTEGPIASSSTYRVTHRHTGQLFALRRLHDFNFAFTKLPLIIEQWKKLSHPNLVQLREVFSTKVFGDQSLIFVYDYYPGSLTLLGKYMMVNRIGYEDIDPFNSDPDAPRPYSYQKNTILRATHGGSFMPENTIWNIIVQVTSALRIIHNAGLSCWYLDPSKVIVNGSAVRISWGGINEIIKVATCGSAGLPMSTEDAQQEDLNALGRLVLSLVCQANLPNDAHLISIYMQMVTRDYSTDLKNVVAYLLSVPNKPRCLLDLMPMIGARFYTFTENLQRHVDALEDQLSLEMDNGRLYRLLVKLNTVVDRPELNMDHSWGETGDRYILKLFRDYMFHPVTPDGRPWLDNAHIVFCLNQLDSGTTGKIQLISRNEHSLLIVSFNELNLCLERAFMEVVEATEPLR